MQAAQHITNYISGKNRVNFDSAGVELVGNLFLPPDFDPGKTYPGVVIGGTWTSVKEQMSDRYAERLAQHGFVTLDYDFTGYGESQGEPRNTESPSRKISDNRHAVSFLASLPFVDANRIGALGICASAGYMAGTTAEDNRVKSLALVAPWIHNAEITYNVYGGREGVQQRLQMADEARRKFDTTGEVDYVLACSDTDSSAAMYGPFEFYLNAERGALPQWDNQFAVMAWRDWLTFDAVQYGAQINVPTLLVHSEQAAVPDGARQFYNAIPAAKDFYWTEGVQFDFYDQEPHVSKSVDAAASHFRLTL